MQISTLLFAKADFSCFPLLTIFSAFDNLVRRKLEIYRNTVRKDVEIFQRSASPLQARSQVKH